MFRSFSSQSERRAFGGSCFMEFQYCRLPQKTSRDRIVDSMDHWKLDSLYLHGDDMGTFWELYRHIFTGGYYGNGKSGVVDMWGINYYTPEQTQQILAQLKQENLPESQRLIDWLEKADCNGFYLCGV